MGSSGPSLNLDQWNRCRIFSSCWYITRGSWWQEQGWTGKGGKQLGMLNSPISCPMIGQFREILGSDWLKWLPQKQPLPGPASGGSLCGHTMLDYAATMPVCITCKIGAAPVRLGVCIREPGWSCLTMCHYESHPSIPHTAHTTQNFARIMTPPSRNHCKRKSTIWTSKYAYAMQYDFQTWQNLYQVFLTL